MLTKIVLKKNHKFIILAAIIFVGIFLRTYNFRSWLLFGPDQARDALIIEDALEGKSGPILLGAQAGNTQFHLGPLYYQMQSFSAEIFGLLPDKLAYPDWLFSVLTIPLLYFFLRKYFSPNITLFLSALYSIAYFSIYSARFAVNSNSLPFFVLLFLYSLSAMLDEKNKDKHVWAILTGLSLGAGIQLHALAFLVMPIVALAVCVYLLKRKNLTGKNFLLVVAFFLLANFGQISYEMKNDSANLKSFFKGANSESADAMNSFGENISLTLLCQIRASVDQIVAVNDSKYCVRDLNLKKTFANFNEGKSFIFLLTIVLGAIYMFGGYWIWVKEILTKKNSAEKKQFLVLLLLLNVVFVGIFSLIIAQAEVHYFNFIFYVSFVILGLWLEKISALHSKEIFKITLFSLLLVVILFMNFFVLKQSAKKYLAGEASNSELSILGEIIPIANYIVENSTNTKIAYLDGDRISTHRFAAPLEYLTLKRGLLLSRWDEREAVENPVIFYVKLINDNNENKLITDMNKKNNISGYQKFGNVMIFILHK